jgi:hypothetical protein
VVAFFILIVAEFSMDPGERRSTYILFLLQNASADLSVQELPANILEDSSFPKHPSRIVLRSPFGRLSHTA